MRELSRTPICVRKLESFLRLGERYKDTKSIKRCVKSVQSAVSTLQMGEKSVRKINIKVIKRRKTTRGERKKKRA